jgi:hypothetical protein
MKKDIKTLWNATSGRSSFEHCQLCILKALSAKGEDKLAIAKHFIRKAFTPITKVTKLANGRTPFDTVRDMFYRYHYNGKHSTILGLPIDEVLTEEEQEQYHDIAKSLSNRGGLVRRYSYFFGRQDYFDEYQAVQIAHAALELGTNLTKDQAKDLHFTVCGVDDLRALEDVERVLENMKIPYVTFREPDIGNQKTAIGVYPVEEHRRGLLRNYNLLRFKKNNSAEEIELEEEIV